VISKRNVHEKNDPRDNFDLPSSYLISALIHRLEKSDRSNSRLEYRNRFDTNKPEDQLYRCCDKTIARKWIGFKIGVPFEEGLKQTIEW